MTKKDFTKALKTFAYVMIVGLLAIIGGSVLIGISGFLLTIGLRALI